jgi:hypothetical protein
MKFVFKNRQAMKIQITFLLLLLYQLGDCQSVVIDPSVANSNLIAIESTNKSILTPRLSSSQRTAINSPSSGLLVYDTTTNSIWYYNGTGWGEMSVFSLINQWQINGANQYSPASSTVGINIFAARAKFQTGSYNGTQAIFGRNYSGISLAANPPAIGFNVYKDTTETNRRLTLGYGFLQEFDPSIGRFSLRPLSYGNQDSAAVQSDPWYYITNSGQFGSKSSAGISAQTRFFNGDYSRFGENSPNIKCRVYTGTTSGERTYNPESGHYEYTRFTNLSLAMSTSRILKVSIIIECGGSRPYVPPNQCGDSFYGSQCYRYYLGSSGYLTIVHQGESSLETYEKPFRVFIIYTE